MFIKFLYIWSQKFYQILQFLKFFRFFQTFLKFAGTGSHHELPFTPKSVAFSGILKNIEATFWRPYKIIELLYNLYLILIYYIFFMELYSIWRTSIYKSTTHYNKNYFLSSIISISIPYISLYKFFLHNLLQYNIRM